MHILVVGAGSIGQRHIRNLVELGIRTSVVEPNYNKWKWDDDETVIDAVGGYHTKVEHAMYENSYDAAIVAVPTHKHIDIACELASHNMPLFIEKPVSHNTDRIGELKYTLDNFNQWAVVGYSMRFHPALQIIKDLLSQIGTPLYARAEVGQYLPDWHPGEDYSKWYMAHEDQGGGALLDLSHEIDYMRWLFGEVHTEKMVGFVGKTSDLDIDSDDCAEFMAGFGEQLLGSVHMDLLDRSYNRRLRIVGSGGSIWWGAEPGNARGNGAVWSYTADDMQRAHLYDLDRNIQFKEEMAAFVSSVESGVVHPTLATLDDGIEVLKVCLALKEQNGR